MYEDVKTAMRICPSDWFLVVGTSFVAVYSDENEAQAIDDSIFVSGDVCAEILTLSDEAVTAYIRGLTAAIW